MGTDQNLRSRSKLADLVRQCSKLNGFKLIDRWRTNQVHALNPPDPSSGAGTGSKLLTISSVLSTPNDAVSLHDADPLLLSPFPTTSLLEPQIDPFLKPLDLIDALADVHRRLETCSVSDKSSICLEQYNLLRGLGDPKLLRRCLTAARQHAGDVHSKVVLSAWLRHERREDELSGISSMNCIGRILECPKSALSTGYDQTSVHDRCTCHTVEIKIENPPKSEHPISNNISFIVENEKIFCNREKIASLSTPLKAMLYGDFTESKRKEIDFSLIGLSVKGMRAVEMFSRTRELNPFEPPNLVLELLSFSNRFCCDELKAACDSYLASIVSTKEEALILMDYGLEEFATRLVASCLLVFLRELPGILRDRTAQRILCWPGSVERLAMVGHSSFLLYYFLTQVAMELSMKWDVTLMLTNCLTQCARENWQKSFAFHQLGCVLLEREEYKEARLWFNAAADMGHVYSIAGVARAKHKQGNRFSAFKSINSLITENNGISWMYQERSLYNVGIKRILDLKTASDLDPALEFPYHFRAMAMLEENQVESAISEMNKIIGFKVSPISLELRAWCYVARKDYESALRDVRALLMVEPEYIMLNGNVKGRDFFHRLNQKHVVEIGSSVGECWLQLYDCWSAVDDIRSLAVIHKMLENESGKSFMWFRQSLLLLRLNCQKAAMRSLRLARNHAASDHDRLVYEGWILYDTGHREEALSRAELSISIQRSFEAFFLKAYVLADAASALDSETSGLVIALLEEALKCPSDGLRKGQALNNLGSIYVDCGNLDLAADCYVNALNIKHTRAHQGLARVYHLKNQRKSAYEEMTKLIEKAHNKASAYEKRSEYCERELASPDLYMATRLDPLRTYPYRFRAAVLMDDQREAEAVDVLTKAISFKPDLQMINLRAAFYESIGQLALSIRDCEAALCLDPTHKDTIDMYNRTRTQYKNRKT